MQPNHQSPGSGRAPQRVQDALLLLRRFRRELRLFRARGLQRCLHCRAFLFDALDEFLPALFLEFAHRNAREDGALRVGSGEQTSRAL